MLSEIFGSFQRCKSLLSQCIALRDLNSAKVLHSCFIKTSLISDTFVSNRIIEFYSKCDSIDSAQKAFDDLPYKNTRSWNALVFGYVKNGLFDQAHNLLDEMPEPDIVSYNSVISGLSHFGLHEESVGFFKKMQSSGTGLLLDEYTVVNVVSTCAVLSAVQLLRQLHGVVILLGLQFDVAVCNALIYAYGKCGLPELSYCIFNRMVERDVVSWTSMVVAFSRASRLEDASVVFHRMPSKNIVSWTVLISGLSQNGRGLESLDLFDQMLKDGVVPNSFTYVSVLSVCADLALLAKGKQLHCHIIRSSMMSVYICNSLIDMYCKCGDVRSARHLFEAMPEKDVVSWNTMITGFAQNGHSEESLTTFQKMMEDAKVIPNHVTFLGVLSACSHTGRIDEAMRTFALMSHNDLKLTSEHYAVFIDLLGRKNRLNEAVELIKGAPGGSDHVGMWGALLGACRVHGNVGLAKKAAEMLFQLDPSNPGRYVMLSNVYASGRRWDDSDRVRSLMCDRGLKKEAGFSWIEVNSRRHEFVAKDTAHVDREAIYEVIHGLVDQMRDVGYCPSVEIGLEDGEGLCDYEQLGIDKKSFEIQ